MLAIGMERVSVTVTLYTPVVEVLASNLGRDIAYRDWVFRFLLIPCSKMSHGSVRMPYHSPLTNHHITQNYTAQMLPGCRNRTQCPLHHTTLFEFIALRETVSYNSNL